MFMLLFSMFAYIVWLFTGVNPLPHINIGVFYMGLLEVTIEILIVLLFAFLICSTREE